MIGVTTHCNPMFDWEVGLYLESIQSAQNEAIAVEDVVGQMPNEMMSHWLHPTEDRGGPPGSRQRATTRLKMEGYHQKMKRCSSCSVQ